MTDEELLAEISEDHGPETARLVAEILGGARGEPVKRRPTRAGERFTRAGVRGRGGVVDAVRPGNRFSNDPGGVSQASNGPGNR